MPKTLLWFTRLNNVKTYSVSQIVNNNLFHFDVFFQKFISTTLFRIHRINDTRRIVKNYLSNFFF